MSRVDLVQNKLKLRHLSVPVWYRQQEKIALQEVALCRRHEIRDSSIHYAIAEATTHLNTLEQIPNVKPKVLWTNLIAVLLIQRPEEMFLIYIYIKSWTRWLKPDCVMVARQTPMNIYSPVFFCFLSPLQQQSWLKYPINDHNSILGNMYSPNDIKRTVGSLFGSLRS